MNPKDETVANLKKVTEGIIHILADEIVHSKEAADQIRQDFNDPVPKCSQFELWTLIES